MKRQRSSSCGCSGLSSKSFDISPSSRKRRRHSLQDPNTLPPAYSKILFKYEDPPVASFLGIPKELRALIIKYVLSLTGDKKCRIVQPPYRKDYILQGYPELVPSDPRKGYDKGYFEILRVNKQCNFEASHLLYMQTVTIEITEKAFVCYLNPDQIARNLYEAQSKRLSYTWWPTLHGIDFSRLNALELEVEPFNSVGYWYTIQNCLTTFYNQRLANSLPLKTFRIRFFDMMRNHMDLSRLGPNHGVPGEHEPIVARFEDYEETLEIFKEVIQKALQCEIFLPYWMQTYERAASLATMWNFGTSVQVHYMPLPTWSETHSRDHAFSCMKQNRISQSSEVDNEDGEKIVAREDFPCLAGFAK